MIEILWYEFKCIVQNSSGIHGRPATDISRLAEQYAGKVELRYQDKTYNPKSLFSLLGAGISRGAHLSVRIERAEGYEEFSNLLKRLIEKTEG